MADWTCPGCGKQQHPSFELNAAGKMVARCVKEGCGTLDGSVGPEHFTTAAVCVEAGVPGSAGKMEFRPLAVGDQALNQSRPSYGKTLIAPEAALAPSPVGQRASVPFAPAPRFAHDPSQPVDAIAVLRARRDFLEAELARMTLYKAEKKALDKMLALAMRVEQSKQIAAEIDAAIAGKHAGSA